MESGDIAKVAGDQVIEVSERVALQGVSGLPPLCKQPPKPALTLCITCNKHPVQMGLQCSVCFLIKPAN